MTGNKCW